MNRVNKLLQKKEQRKEKKNLNETKQISASFNVWEKPSYIR